MFKDIGGENIMCIKYFLFTKRFYNNVHYITNASCKHFWIINLFAVVICKRLHATPDPCIKCGVNTVKFMTASYSTDFTHLAIVSLEAGLYGFDVVMNKQVMLPMRDLVTSMYCLNSLNRTSICIFIDWKL